MVFSSWKKELRELFPRERKKFDFGEAVGMLAFREWYPCIRKGHGSHMLTYDFPIRLKFVEDYLSWEKDSLFNTAKFIEKAKELEQEGVEAIVTGCGMTALIQKELSESVDIPVFTSTLLFVPLISRALRRKQKVGILTISSELLFAQGKKILKNSGIDESVPISVKGMRESGYAKEWLSQFGESYDEKKVEEAIVRVAKEMVSEDPEVGAIVLECTEMPHFSSAIQKATGLPVFDNVDMVKLVHNMLKK